jgi:RNA polymerase sigma-70 factor, ECF subfamily
MDSSASSPPPVTALLQAWGQGDQQALERLTPLVYDELHRRARRYLAREPAGHTLQATALVNEAYLRLVDAEGVRWQDRAHFFALSAQMMRRILVDAARVRRAEKRGGQEIRVTLDDGVGALHRDDDLVRLDEALAALADLDGRKARVIELRFFGGLSVEETAEVLHLSPQSVLRDWSLAKAWLAREMKRGV